MLKKSLVLMGVAAAFYAQAQDVSIIRNSIDVYSGSPMVGSAKFNAMGGANGALGGDANSLLTNPAGLGVAISGEVNGTLSISNYKNTSSFGGAAIDYNKTKGDLGNVGAVMTFQLMSESAWKFINVGVNFSSQSIDNYIETPGNNNIVNPDQGYFGGHAYSREGYLTRTSIGVGANYNHAFYIGAGLNFFNTSIDQYDTARFNSVTSGDARYFDKNETPFFERGNGFSASLGVIGKVGPMFRLGASIETPTFWEIDRSYDFYNDPVYGDDTAIENRRFSSPLKASVSAAFVPSKNLSLDVDYTLGLTKPKYKEYSSADVAINNFFNDNYKNLSELRIGAEYRLKQVRLRGGYSYASSPIDALTVSRFSNDGNVADASYSNLILSDRNALSLGIGYDFGAFYIDASYQNISSKYTNPFMYGILEPENGINTAYYVQGTNGAQRVESDSFIVSDVKSVRNNFFLTLGWKF